MKSCFLLVVGFLFYLPETRPFDGLILAENTYSNSKSQQQDRISYTLLHILADGGLETL